MNVSEIISALPYQSPFLFVDDLTAISENGISGNYTFKKEAFFYQGHFKNNPITPGVILTETMAQIGVVCLGIFLMKDNISLNIINAYLQVAFNKEALKIAIHQSEVNKKEFTFSLE